MPAKTLIIAPLLTLLLAACAGADDDREPEADALPGDTAAASDTATAGDTAAASDPADPRPDVRTDTLFLEGMPEPIELGLFRAPDGFPLPFSAYIPSDMAVEVEAEGEAGEGAAARFVAEFGGHRNDDAFVHVFVFPPGTDANTAIAQARGYKASRGVPAGKGVEPLGDSEEPQLAWALQAYRFRYESGGTWYQGLIGVGEREGRYFQLVRHYPAEYGDGFGPRAALIEETWRWEDGSRLTP